MTDPTRLTDMEYDEVSLVGIPANQHAEVVLFKSSKKTDEDMDEEDEATGDDAMDDDEEMDDEDEPKKKRTRRSKKGKLALAKHTIRIAKGNPTPSDVHHDSIMGDKKKRKKRTARKGKHMDDKKGQPDDPGIEVTKPHMSNY